MGEIRPEENRAAAMRWLGTLDLHLTSLRQAIAEEQSREASAAAHRLRSHGGLIGAQKLSQAAGALQVAVDNGDHGDPNFPTLLGAVETAAAKAKSRVEDWISRQGANGEDPGVGI